MALIEYNEYNELLSEADPLGFTTRYIYDERGNCLQLTLADGAKWQREYDAQDQLTALTDAVGGRWQWTHDEAGNILTQTTPTGTTSCCTYAQGLLVRHVTEALQAIYQRQCAPRLSPAPAPLPRRVPSTDPVPESPSPVVPATVVGAAALILYILSSALRPGFI